MKRAKFQSPSTQPDQQVLDLVERLDCSRWIVDGRRERLDRDIDQQTEGVLGVLLERTLVPEFNRTPQNILGKWSGAIDSKNRGRIEHRVADRGVQLDRAIVAARDL